MTKTLLLLSLLFFSQDWPGFRGPTGQGHSDERGLPLTWNESKNVRWKVAIPGKGWSSPAIQGDRVWLTTATDEGKSLRAISVDRNTGAILKNVEVFRLKSLTEINAKNSFASPTPLLEGDRIYLHFGALGTACLTESGEIAWKTRLDYDNGQHGPGGSPVIYDDLLIVSCDGLSIQYVVALDKLTGKVRWRKYRQGYQAYTTPLVVRLPAGDQVISPGAFRAIAYDPRTGKELWQVRYGEGFSNVPRPIYGDGLVLHLQRVPGSVAAGGSFGWTWGRHQIAHSLVAQPGRAAHSVSAAGRRGVVFHQRQWDRNLRGREDRNRTMASPPGRRSLGLSDLRRRTHLLPQRRGRVGRDRARQGIQGTGEEPARWADAGFDGRLERLDLRAQPDPSLPAEQLKEALSDGLFG